MGRLVFGRRRRPEMERAETPISAIRTTRADVCGLTVGKTTKAELTAIRQPLVDIKNRCGAGGDPALPAN